MVAETLSAETLQNEEFISYFIANLATISLSDLIKNKNKCHTECITFKIFELKTISLQKLLLKFKLNFIMQSFI